MSEFKREPRYIVLKLKDIEAYLSPVEKEALMVMCVAIHKGRTDDGKAPFNAVVVEQDWPEFEPTWEAIEGRMTGTPIEPRYAIRLRIKGLEARVADLEAQNALLVEALEKSAQLVDHILKEGGGTYGDAIRRLAAAKEKK